jgi:RimJ/RimL family protein N-acetyltransferase
MCAALQLAPSCCHTAAVIAVRAADLVDVDVLGSIHVRAWQAAYRGYMPDAYLDGLRAGVRAAMWAQNLSRPLPGSAVLVAEREGSVVGFAALGADREAQDTGELFALNVDPDHWGSGVGQALLGSTCAELSKLGFAEAVLWVLPGNARARRLYEAAGWTPDGAARTADVLGVTVGEVRYRRALPSGS